ncbi:MAG: signal peptide peptidase SppA [Acetobacteraceae bacterium]|nr:signal peptide peptidase SppA [Acetobacteraceae bacterium]
MLETDLLLDRRRLKRRLNFWRVAAVLAVTAAIAAIAVPGVGHGGRHLARVNVTGIITEDQRRDDAVLALAKDRSVPAVIVSIDSPGGAVAGGESLRSALMRVAAAKPVVAVMRGTAASAGYMVALPAERIFARSATLTGSIGVILQTGEVSGLLSRLGITAEAITSGPLKDQPSFTRPLTPEGREYLNGLVAEMYQQFVAMVAEARHLDLDTVRKLADGRAYTGRQAKDLGLIDELGGEVEARAWLATRHGISESTPVRDLKRGDFYDRTFGSAFNGMRTLLFGEVATGFWSIWPGL